MGDPARTSRPDAIGVESRSRSTRGTELIPSSRADFPHPLLQVGAAGLRAAPQGHLLPPCHLHHGRGAGHPRGDAPGGQLRGPRCPEEPLLRVRAHQLSGTVPAETSGILLVARTGPRLRQGLQRLRSPLCAPLRRCGPGSEGIGATFAAVPAVTRPSVPLPPAVRILRLIMLLPLDFQSAKGSDGGSWSGLPSAAGRSSSSSFKGSNHCSLPAAKQQPGPAVPCPVPPPESLGWLQPRSRAAGQGWGPVLAPAGARGAWLLLPGLGVSQNGAAQPSWASPTPQPPAGAFGCAWPRGGPLL